MNGINSQLLAIHIMIIMILFPFLVFAVWGAYRSYKKRQTGKSDIILSLGATICEWAGMRIENVGHGSWHWNRGQLRGWCGAGT